MSIPEPRDVGLSAFADRFPIIFCDVWGVLHNGVGAFQSAVDALRGGREAGATVILVTNAPRPAENVVAQLERLGIGEDAFDRIVTSGDVMRGLLKEREGERVFHLGPERDRSLFEGIGLAFVDADEADFILCSGLFDDTTETPEDYRAMLARLSEKERTFLCANPDLVVERGGALVYCAGALAELYRSMGGQVVYAGKPHPPIYDLGEMHVKALKGYNPAPANVLAIGDSIRTDLKGAEARGYATLFIRQGIHAGEGDALQRKFNEAGVTPIAVMDQLFW